MSTCANHTATPATAYCRTCGKPLCEVCKRDVRGVVYCEECIAARLQDTMPAAIPAASAGAPITPVVVVDAPNVGLATFLGFIPGVGAMYNGQFIKGFAHIFIFAMLANAADRADVFGFFVVAFIAYMVIDANKTAKARRGGEPFPGTVLGPELLRRREGVERQLGFGLAAQTGAVVEQERIAVR